MKKVHVLGVGCLKCVQTAEHAEAAAKALSLEIELIKVKTVPEIAKFGVLSTPALAVEGTVKVAGRVPSVDEIKKWLSE